MHNYNIKSFRDKYIIQMKNFSVHLQMSVQLRGQPQWDFSMLINNRGGGGGGGGWKH